MSEAGGVQIAYGDPLDAFPSWESLTRVRSWESYRGRQSEFLRTEAGTISVAINDVTGYLGADAEMPTHIRSSLRGSPRFRGHVEEHAGDVHPSGVKTDVGLDGVDAFGFLSRFEPQPGIHGHPVDAGREAYVLYEEAPIGGIGLNAGRIGTVLDDVGWSNAQRSIYSGNVTLFDQPCSPGTSALQVLQEAVDAEWPGVANLFVDALGRICFRGRHARFNPSAYGFNFWQAGTEAFVGPGVAQMRVLGWSKGMDMVVNSAIAYPQGMDDKQMSQMVYEDATSIARYGRRSWSRPDLLTERHNSNGNSGADECLLFSRYQVENHKTPVPRITKIRFRTLRDSDPRAAATWALMCGVEIGDVVDVMTRWLSGRYFVEGIRTFVQELDGTIPDATVDLDLSPAAHWTVDPF